MQWNCAYNAGYFVWKALQDKAVRLGVTVSDILRMAVNEYLERNPIENEPEEIKKYPKRGGNAYEFDP